jgi:uncharacterized protein YfcZ (UPF0381/DUF406 family)
MPEEIKKEYVKELSTEVKDTRAFVYKKGECTLNFSFVISDKQAQSDFMEILAQAAKDVESLHSKVVE